MTKTYYERNRAAVLKKQELRREKYGRSDGDTLAQRRRSRQKKREWLNAFKSKPCQDCGQSFPPECMDWDHVRGKKLFCLGLSAGQRISKKRMLKEMSKCELVCANCHRVRTTRRERARKSVR